MQVKTQQEDFQNYLTDASNMAGGHLSKLYIPENAYEIAAIVREANDNGSVVTISGARTGTVGGAVPFGGVVVSMEKLNNIKSIDRASHTAVVEPGVILGDFQKAVESEGLFYPPDPTEWSCQIGGTVATNASGARSFKYGATRNFVKGLKVLLANGETLTLRRGQKSCSDSSGIVLETNEGREISVKMPTYKRPDVRKNVSGYFVEDPFDPIDLFIGSEGTLGVITEIELALVTKPVGFFSGVVFFADESDLLSFVDEIKAASYSSRRNQQGFPGAAIDATLVEYFDERSLKFISEKFPYVPDNVSGAIFFEQETSIETEDALLEQWNELLETHHADLDRSWFTTTESDREKMRAFRHALPVSVNERIARNGQRKIGTDIAVPDDRFRSFLRFYKDTLDASGLDYVIFGHIADSHLHANILPKNAIDAEQARHLYGRFIAQAIMLGGTVSAEHGIGKLKSKYLHVMMGERYLNEMAEVKRAFDPKGILGRGNMIAERFLL